MSEIESFRKRLESAAEIANNDKLALELTELFSVWVSLTRELADAMETTVRVRAKDGCCLIQTREVVDAVSVTMPSNELESKKALSWLFFKVAPFLTDVPEPFIA